MRRASCRVPVNRYDLVDIVFLMAATGLSRRQQQLWRAFKTAGETVTGRVGASVEKATNLSTADYDVLSHLESGAVNQQELGKLMGWEKTRLSHHLTRMAARGLVSRASGPGNRVSISILKAGRDIFLAAKPVHAASVRRQLLDRLTPDQEAAILKLFSSISNEEQ